MKNAKKRKVIDIYPPHTFTSATDEKKQSPEKSVQNEEEENIIINIKSTPKDTQKQLDQVEYLEQKEKAEKDLETIKKDIEDIDLFSEENIKLPSISKPVFEIKRPRLNIDKKKIASIILSLFLIAIFYYLGFVALVKAEVLINAKKLTLSLDNSQVLIDKNITEANYNQKVIPGNLFIFSEEEKQDFKSTGQAKDEQYAKGVITIINNYSSSPQILVARTRFEHPSGKIFRLDSRIVIPGATIQDGKLQPSSIDANVTADQPGPEYNIPSCNGDCKFTIPGFKGTSKFDGFYGISNKPMTGGTSGSVPMVTPEDLKKAEDVILEKISNKINEDFKNKIPKDLKILDGAKSSIKIVKLNSDASSGDFRQNFTVTGVGEIKVIAFKEQDLIDLIQNQIANQKPDKYDYCGAPTIEYKEVKPDFEKGALRITFSAKQTLCYRLSLDDLKKEIAGKDQKELNIIFQSIDGIETAKVKLFPFWIKTIPNNLKKINITIQ